MGPHRRDLELRLAGIDDTNARAAIAAEAILTRFAEGGVTLTVVGGSAVALWDPAAHVSNDIDLVGVATGQDMAAVLVREFGFAEHGRHWYDDTLRLAVELPAWTLEPHGARAVMIGRVRVISLEDLILDRVEQWDALGAHESWRQAARLLEHGLLDRQHLFERARAIGACDPLIAIQLLAAWEREAYVVDPPLSHAAQRALTANGVPAVEELLRGLQETR